MNDMTTKRLRKIERDLKKRFPGWRGKVWSDSEGVHMEKKSRIDFYNLYPGLTTDEADKQIVEDTVSVIREHIPGFELTGYERRGKYNEVTK